MDSKKYPFNDVVPPTPEELAAQRAGYGEGYKQGPRQARPDPGALHGGTRPDDDEWMNWARGVLLAWTGYTPESLATANEGQLKSRIALVLKSDWKVALEREARTAHAREQADCDLMGGAMVELGIVPADAAGVPTVKDFIAAVRAALAEAQAPQEAEGDDDEGWLAHRNAHSVAEHARWRAWAHRLLGTPVEQQSSAFDRDMRDAVKARAPRRRPHPIELEHAVWAVDRDARGEFYGKPEHIEQYRAIIAATRAPREPEWWTEQNVDDVVAAAFELERSADDANDSESLMARANRLRTLAGRAPRVGEADEKDAVEQAIDAIASMCGCPDWEYPGQVIRDVAGCIAGQWAPNEDDPRLKAARARVAKAPGATPPVEPDTPADPVLPEGARQALVDAVVDKNIDGDGPVDMLELMKLCRRMMHEVAIRAFELGAKGASDV